MSIAYEDANGVVQTMQKRAVAKTHFNGETEGVAPIACAESVYVNESELERMFKSKTQIDNHIVDFADIIAKDYKLNHEKKKMLIKHIRGFVEKMPAEMKRPNRAAAFNKAVQEELNKFAMTLR